MLCIYPFNSSGPGFNCFQDVILQAESLAISDHYCPKRNITQICYFVTWSKNKNKNK